MLASQYLDLGNDKLAKTKADESKDATVDKDGKIKSNEVRMKNGRRKISVELKQHINSSMKRSSLSSLGRIRSLLSMPLKMRKEKKIQKPSERLEESIVEKESSEKELGEEPVKETEMSSKNLSFTPQIDRIDSFVLDKTQPDVTIEDEVQAADHVEQRPPSNLAPSPHEDQTQLDDLAPAKVDDLKILEVKVKQQIRLYAKITFCSTLIVFSITFVILIIIIFGWWISLSAHELLNYEQAVRLASGWTNRRNKLLIKPASSWSSAVYGIFQACRGPHGRIASEAKHRRCSGGGGMFHLDCILWMNNLLTLINANETTCY